jgi:predicted helicase
LNKVIAISGTGSTQPYHTLAFKTLTERHTVEKSQCLPLYRYTKEGSRIDNITDWALQQFREHYQQNELHNSSDTSKVSDEYDSEVQNHFQPNEPSSPVCYAGSRELREEFLLDIQDNNIITKQDIFHYVYAVLHHPAYRKKYELNLKREFPRIPFYDNFFQWCKWGEQLMQLHIGYENVEPYPLQPLNPEGFKNPRGFDGFAPKPKLKANKATGEIELDSITTLTGIPKIAWEYKLGNRSALEWVLDQYKEKKPGDPTIAEKFNTYKFADYKEHVIELLKRVCTVSVETMRIIEEMQK